MEMISVTLTKPSDKASAVIDSIIDTMNDEMVLPDEFVPVLAESIIRLLVHVASAMEIDAKEFVKYFGNTISTADFDIAINRD